MDLRHVNALLDDEGFAGTRMPHGQPSEVLARVREFKYATSLDLKSGYHQFPVAKEDQHKTTFQYGGKYRQWARWPFGLRPCVPQFQKVMEIVMDGLDCLVIYVDDLLIFTNGSFEDHIAQVQEVLRRLNEHNLRLNVDKCFHACAAARPLPFW